MNTLLYVRTDTKFTEVRFFKNRYCKRTGKRLLYVPIEPKPRNEEIVKLRIYYSALKHNEAYKRKITWRENEKEQKKSCALYEYLGEHPGHYGHAPNELQVVLCWAPFGSMHLHVAPVVFACFYSAVW